MLEEPEQDSGRRSGLHSYLIEIHPKITGYMYSSLDYIDNQAQTQVEGVSQGLFIMLEKYIKAINRISQIVYK